MYTFKRTLLLLAACGVGGGAYAADAQPPYSARVAVINIERSITESAPGKAAAGKILAEFSVREKAIQEQQLQFRQLSEKLQGDVGGLSERDLNMRKRELEDFERNLERKRTAFRDDLAARQDQERNAIAGRVYEAITDLQRQQDIDIVVFRSYWHSPRVDITEQVIKMLDK